MKTKTRRKLSTGTRVAVKKGVAAPEFPDVDCAGWTGTVMDTVGKKSDPTKYVIEWDESVIDSMPDAYLRQCEEQSLFYRMACFAPDQIEVVEEGS